MKWVDIGLEPPGRGHQGCCVRGQQHDNASPWEDQWEVADDGRWPGPEAATSSHVQCTYDRHPSLCFLFSTTRCRSSQPTPSRTRRRSTHLFLLASSWIGLQGSIPAFRVDYTRLRKEKFISKF